MGHQPKGNRPEAGSRGGVMENTGVKFFSKFDRNTFYSLRDESIPVRILVKTAFALNIPYVEVYKNNK